MSNVDSQDPGQQMMLTIDNIAHRYGLLPSEVLTRASTLDLAIIDLSARWEQQRSNPKSTPQPPKLSQEQMLAMTAAAKKSKK